MSSTSPRPWPTRRTFVFGLAASLLFALYGSLVPFDLRAVPLAIALHRFEAVWTWPLQIWSKSDVLANVLLMMPVACFAMGALRVDRDRSWWRAVLAAIATIVGGALYAAGLEFSQIFTPDRVVSQSDVLAQTLGACGGVAVWLLAGQPMTEWLRGAIGGAHHVGYRRLHALLALYAVGWLILLALPLDLSLSPVEIVHKYRAGGIVLVPFGAAYSSRADLLWDAIAGILSGVPLGVLAVLTVMALRPGRAGLLTMMSVGGAFVLAGEFVQLLVAERVADVTDVLCGWAGVAIGVSLAFRRVQAAPASDSARVLAPRSSRAAWAGACGWIVLLAFYHWKPFTFSTDLVQARERVAHLSLMPLRQYQWETGMQLLSQALLKSGLGVPLGLCLAPLLRRCWLEVPSATRLRWAACGVAALVVFGMIEAGQVLLPDRVPDVTDVLLGCAGTLAGFGIALSLSLDLTPARRAAEACQHEG